MKIEVVFKNARGDERSITVERSDAPPEAESVRQALAFVPDDGTAYVVEIDGRRVL